MAQGTTVTLLAQRSYPGPQGTAIAYDGTRQHAAAYYLGNRDLQTISWILGPNNQNPTSNNQPPSDPNSQFVGNIYIQASIATDPTADDWVTVYSIDTANSQVGYTNLSGTYVWLRAIVRDWTQGIIRTVSASY